jgi:hypothetical protein
MSKKKHTRLKHCDRHATHKEVRPAKLANACLPVALFA